MSQSGTSFLNNLSVFPAGNELIYRLRFFVYLLVLTYSLYIEILFFVTKLSFQSIGVFVETKKKYIKIYSSSQM